MWYAGLTGLHSHCTGGFGSADSLCVQLLHVCFEEEISRGYLTLPGGHRMGLTGEAVLTDSDRVREYQAYFL